jgi:signal transduction histidine kinase
MKRSWFSILMIVGVIGVLTLFLGLQYRWLSKVSEAERERMQKRAETDASRLAEDFNREIQAAYYNFQTGGEMWAKSDWHEFNERYDFWKSRTSYPELIRDIYFIGKQPEAKPLIYNTTRRSFETSESNERLDSLRTRFTDEKSFRAVYEDADAMVLPIYSGDKRFEHIILKRSEREVPPIRKMPEKYGWLVILLDGVTIKERMLPELAAKYFPENNFDAAVFDRNEQPIFATRNSTTAPDATASLFDLSPDNLLFFARDIMPRTNGENRHDVVINQRVERHTFSSTETRDGKSDTFKVEVQRQPADLGKPRTPMIASGTKPGDGPWTLRVQHVDGSIDAFVQNERNKSFLIGFAVYLLLIGGIVAIFLSALRSKRFAQRQIDFVSSVSHEFRTPLAVIYSAGENLADGVAKEGPQVSRYGEMIKSEGKKLSAMVEQVLEFAGANSGKRKYNLRQTGVADVVSDALRECRALVESGGFKVETELQDDLPLISADKAALSSAIQNLIANSVKYSNGSKWLKISASNGGDVVKIEVEDKGMGIAGDDLGRIFEPFYRARAVVDAQISGNGLGLNLVKNIVEAHGGKVSAVSKPGSGSKFTIELPRS